MRDRWNSVTEGTNTPKRRQFVDLSVQTDRITVEEVVILKKPEQTETGIKKEQNLNIKKLEEQSMNLNRSIPSIKVLTPLGNSNPKPKPTATTVLPSFKKLLPSSKNHLQTPPPILILQPEHELSLTLDLKRSHLEIDDLSPRPNQESTIRRMNTFSHYEKESVIQSQKWMEQMNVTMSVEYSELLLEQQEDGITVIEKVSKIEQQMGKKRKERVIVKKKYQQQKSQERLDQQTKEKPSKQLPGQTLFKIPIHLQTGNSHYQLERRLLLMYPNDLIIIASITSIPIETLKILRLKPLRNNFYEMKGETQEGAVVTRIVKLKDRVEGLGKYLEVERRE